MLRELEIKLNLPSWKFSSLCFYTCSEYSEKKKEFAGVEAGSYVRVVLDSVPCEFMTFFDPKFPVLVGGLLATEEQLGLVQVFSLFSFHNNTRFV